MAERVQLSRKRGWRMPPNTVKVDRTSPFGNHVAKALGLAKGPVAKEVHRSYLKHDASRQLRAAARKQLDGKNLACWCGLDQPCHADNWLEFLYGAKRDI